MQRNYSIKVLTTPPDHGERDFLPAYHFIVLQLPMASPSNGVTQNDLTLFNISEISCGASYMNTLCFTTQQANNNFLLHTQLPIILYTQLKTWQLKSLVTSNIFCVNVYIEVTVYSVPSLNYFMLWCISLYYAATVNHKSNATSEVRMQMILHFNFTSNKQFHAACVCHSVCYWYKCIKYHRKVWYKVCWLTCSLLYRSWVHVEYWLPLITDI